MLTRAIRCDIKQQNNERGKTNPIDCDVVQQFYDKQAKCIYQKSLKHTGNFRVW